MSDGTTTRSGGGPLRAIADDARRPAGERALAGSLIGFMRQRQALHARRQPLFPDVDMSFAQVKLLFHVPLEGSIPAGQFATAAGLSPATASQALELLAAAGAIDRVRSTEDRRVVHVSLTAAGHEALEAMRRAFGERWHSVMSGFDDEELQVAARVVDAAITLFGPPPDPEHESGEPAILRP